MIVTSVGQIGCIPYELARFNGNNSRCNDDINKAIQIFNTEIIRLVNRFYSQFPGAKFVYMDFYQNTVDLYRKARSYGTRIAGLIWPLGCDPAGDEKQLPPLEKKKF
uniref:Uncharacterized protein n=1 Tax=Cannabis sativa TaxID=3483 RepID=A0A803PU28_CANSA